MKDENMVRVGKGNQCDFATIQEAVDFIEQQVERKEITKTIEIEEGVYQERVRIQRSNVRLVGKGKVKVIAGSFAREKDELGQDIGTFATATLFLGGQNYYLENLMIENNAGQGSEVGQAVAVYAHCDKAIFKDCVFLGHQDTLCTGPLPPFQKDGTAFGGIPIKHYYPNYRQLYVNCRIEGTVDFIFGGATAYFDHCKLFSRDNQNGTPNYVTAASTPQSKEYGFVFNQCSVQTGDGQQTYLGRPWRKYAKTIFCHCALEGEISSAGWDYWGNPENKKTVDYQEIYATEEMVKANDRPDWIKVEQSTKPLTLETVFPMFSQWRMNRYGKEVILE